MSITSAGRIVSIDSSKAFKSAVDEASRLLRCGEVVALPTETVYGLAANAYESRAVERVFSIKGRPAENPIIVHVASIEMAESCVAMWTEQAARLAKAFWPGPLSLVLERSTLIPDVVTGCGPTVGIRWPRHPFIQAVIKKCGFPLAAPSANLANSLSPTLPEHVRKDLGDSIALIVDGGAAQVGIESTVLDLAANPPKLLRPGMIQLAELEAVVGRIDTASRQNHGSPRSPGQLPKHYAPRARLVVRSWNSSLELREEVRSLGVTVSNCKVLSHSNIPTESGFGGVSILPRDAEAYGRALYAELHRCDTPDVELIVVETLPEGEDWRGIRDRITRASGEKMRQEKVQSGEVLSGEAMK